MKDGGTAMVKIRIEGEKDEVERTCDAAAAVLRIVSKSRAYSNRRGGECRVYIECELPEKEPNHD